MLGWHHGLSGHEFEETQGFGDGQRGLACCSSWGCKESDTTEQLNCTEPSLIYINTHRTFLLKLMLSSCEFFFDFF